MIQQLKIGLVGIVPIDDLRDIVELIDSAIAWIIRFIKLT